MTGNGRGLFVLAAVVSSIGLSSWQGYIQARARPADELANPYRTIENYFKLPEGRKFGSVAAIDVDRDGRSIWVFERCGGNGCADSPVAPLLQFDQGGTLVRSLGAQMFVYPHGIHVDRDGNVWVTDGQGKGAKGQQVFKFNPEGKVVLTLGQAGVAGDGPNVFNQPSDVVVGPNGDIFVADGHGGNSNARIVKFSKSGAFIKTWGKKGSGPGEFDAPHALAMDSRGRLFVADRSNNRIQIFDQDGTFVAEWKQFGRPSGIYIDKHDVLYSADTQSDEKTNPGYKRGIRIGSAGDGKVTALIPDADPNGTGEGIAADSAGNLFGSLTAKQAVKRYVKN
jgi:sugar lactone lactonase YvrE